MKKLKQVYIHNKCSALYRTRRIKPTTKHARNAAEFIAARVQTLQAQTMNTFYAFLSGFQKYLHGKRNRGHCYIIVVENTMLLR